LQIFNQFYLDVATLFLMMNYYYSENFTCVALVSEGRAWGDRSLCANALVMTGVFNFGTE